MKQDQGQPTTNANPGYDGVPPYAPDEPAPAPCTPQKGEYGAPPPNTPPKAPPTNYPAPPKPDYPRSPPTQDDTPYGKGEPPPYDTPPPNDDSPYPPPEDGGTPYPPPEDGGSPYPPPEDGGSPYPPPDGGGTPYPPPEDGDAPYPSPEDGGTPCPPPEDGDAPYPRPDKTPPGPPAKTPPQAGKSPCKPGDATPPTKPAGTCGTPGGGTDPNCIELEIQRLSGIIAAADKVKANKSELEQLLPKATKASQDYSETVYDALLVRWKALDKALATDLLPKLDCTIKNWRWLLECRVCPLLANIKALDDKLMGTCEPGTPQACEGLYDKKNRLTQKLTRLTRKADWLKDTLATWEKPADTLKALLDANEALKNKVSDNIGKPDARAYVWDVWTKLLPLHLIMGPRDANGRVVSEIESKLRYCCANDKRDPKDPKAPTVLERLLRPQPHLVVPSQYFDGVLCPLIEEYTAARTAASDQSSELEKASAEIKRTEDKIAESKKNFEANAKTELLKKQPENASTCAASATTQLPTTGQKPDTAGQPARTPKPEGGGYKPGEPGKPPQPKPPTPADPNAPYNTQPPRTGR